MREWLSGKKTNIVAGGVIVIAIGEYMQAGVYTVESLLALFQAQFFPLIVLTFRSAIAKLGNKGE